MYYEQDEYHDWIKKEHNKKVYHQDESTLTDYQRRLLRKMRKHGWLLYDSFDSSRFLHTTQWKIKDFLGKDENGYNQYATVQSLEQHTAMALQPYLYIRNIVAGESKRENHWRIWWYQTTNPNLDNLKTKTDYGECPNCGDMCQPPDMPEIINGLVKDWCYCCDCRIMWTISYPEKWIHDETWKHSDNYNIEDVATFDDEFEPYDC